MKKSKGLKAFHKLIQKSADCGLITRQELVSMLPPLFLDIQPDDLVLDMCAAPGSKTSQLLELMTLGKEFSDILTCEGGVVANDMDERRAYMLTHQIKRINTPGMAVINHEGQFIPTLVDTKPQANSESKFDRKLYYDKILVDVPCSGDGAIRKLPVRWKGWNTRDGTNLHNVQIQLLIRAFQLCKVGGTVVYSTCSLNPIENEAVVTEVLRRAENFSPGSIEVLDTHGKLPGFKGRRGLSKWWVLQEKAKTISSRGVEGDEDYKDYPAEDLFNIYSEFEEIDEKDKKKLKKSMFSLNEKDMKEKYKIHYSMRVLPHDQDTGGFYIAAFKKLSYCYFAEKPAENSKEPKANGEDLAIAALREHHEKKNEESGDKKEEEVGMVEVKSKNEKKKNKPRPGYPNLPKNAYIPFVESMPAHWETICEYYGLDRVYFFY